MLGILSFGGTIISIWLKARDKKEDHVISTLNQNSLAIARLEAKFDCLSRSTTKILIIWEEK